MVNWKFIRKKYFVYSFVKYQKSVCGEVIMENIATPQPFDDFFKTTFLLQLF